MMMSNAETYTHIMKAKAEKFGFESCGVSKAEFLEDDARFLENFLTKNYHGEMGYMENHFDKRLDPRLLVPGAKSVVSLLYNYYPDSALPLLDNFKISKYAYGQDYHEVIKGILYDLVAELQEETGDFQYRIFVDSAPVLERAWARKSGLGWIGKNANLIRKQKGSFFFLAEIICDLPMVYDAPINDHCGSCRKCIDACPTNAIVEDRVIDGSKCISYATIELKNEIPNDFKNRMEDWMFGCDICQDVCPWNRFSKPHKQSLFQPNEYLKSFNKDNWEELSQDLFSEVFRKSPVKRAKFSGLKRNIEFLRRDNLSDEDASKLNEQWTNY